MEILTTILSPALVTGLIGWFVKSIAESSLKAQVETHKAALKSQLELQQAGLEKDVKAAELLLNDKLGRLSFEYQTRFSSYHQKQREVVGEIYGRVSEAFVQVGLLVNYGWLGPEEQRILSAEKTLEVIRDFQSYYRRNRIYLDEESCRSLDLVESIMTKSYQYYEIGIDTQKADYREARKTFQEAAADLSKNASPVLQSLQEKFRHMVSAEAQQIQSSTTS